MLNSVEFKYQAQGIYVRLADEKNNSEGSTGGDIAGKRCEHKMKNTSRIRSSVLRP